MKNTPLEKRCLTDIIALQHTPDRAMLARRMRELDEDLWLHARLVAAMTGKLADRLRLSRQDRTDLMDAAWLHDLGKLTVSRAIIDKPGPLDDCEWLEMRAHPVYAADFLFSETALSSVAPLVRHHHERFDGTGYPDKLSGNSIPFGARIIAVVDAFDAMTSERAYRRAISIDAAQTELRRRADSQFDPTVVAAFLPISGDNQKAVMA